MQTIVVERKTNFFERPVSDYLGVLAPRVPDDI